MARFEGGYIKLYRQAYFGDIGSNIHCFGLWCAILCMATWRETKIIWNGEQRVLPPGTAVVGLRELSEKLACSKNTISRWLDYLRRSNRVAVDHGTRGTVVTILNWESYQSSEQEAGTETGREEDAEGTASGHGAPPLVGQQVTLNEEVKKGRREKGKKKEARIGIRATYSPEFEEAWEAFGRVGKKSDAFKAFTDSKLTPEELQDLLRAIPRYLAECRSLERAQQYFGTFLREDWREFLGKPLAASPRGEILSPETRKLREQLAIEEAEIKRIDAERLAAWEASTR
jgi:hypothetical protein